ncbi:vacuolar protein sorting-associated protein 51, putative [Plasmodium gallinaceum]|uniref:Vacuolar protein sorting-associated protein 51, putative n=1 Tax=Plasmodium gallinaceum TaxID=5849 RepID=A0A1J1GLR2_PLAGA|nr:vacuolar protein sorting-associated protein 51, putative [Plasmodium gallinaceum]CRG93284.1 vacuolar protein sorting-associated protein 51, putative [Plasmodium gallinaceum]
MASENVRRKNIGSILYNYYNLDDENNVSKNEDTNNLNKKDCINKKIIIEEDAGSKLKINNHNTKYELNTNVVKEKNTEKFIKNEKMISKEEIKDVDELDKKSCEFNVNNYFKKLLENSSLEELINKSKKIEKEIKQNDSFMQSLVYENYNKFIEAADTIIYLKKNFKNVKEKIKDINDHITYIDNNSNSVNNKVSKNFEKIENLIEIKKLLNDVNIIMKIPQNMFSYIIEKKYIKSLQIFIEAIPFFDKNKNILAFQNLYLDSNNLANIACYFFLKKLNKEKNIKKLPKLLLKNENEKNIDYKNEEKNKNISFFQNDLEKSFELLHSYVLPSDEITSCLYLILAYGKNKKKVRNLYIQNRINALKYLFYNIFNLNNYINIDANVKLKCSTFNSKEKQSEKGNDENDLYNKIFENIFELSYKHLLKFFFSIIDNFEKMFIDNPHNEYEHNFLLSKEDYENNNDRKVKFYKNIHYLKNLINNLNTIIEEKNKSVKKDVMSYINNSSVTKNEKNVKEDLFDINCNNVLKNVLNNDDNNKIIEILTKSFFKVLLKLTIDHIYIINPPVKLIVCSLKKLIENVKNYNNCKNILSKLMNKFINKIYFVVLKLHFYNICFNSNIALSNFLNVCNQKEILFILENKNELGHNIILNLCLTFMDFGVFYEEINVSRNFYFKHLINFVIIYFIFLTNFLNHFMNYFICINEHNIYNELSNENNNEEKIYGKLECKKEEETIEKENDHIKNERKFALDDFKTKIENMENIKESTKILNLQKKCNIYDREVSRESNNNSIKSFKNRSIKDEYSDNSYINKESVFKYENIYLFSYNKEDVKKKSKEKTLKDFKILSIYLYENIYNNNLELQDILKNTKKYMKMDYEYFIGKIIEEQKFEIRRIKEIYFLLSLVSIFYNFKKEGIYKIFTILHDIYKNSRSLLNENKKIYLYDNLEILLYKDIYPFLKKEKSEIKNVNIIECDNLNKNNLINEDVDSNYIVNKNNLRNYDNKIEHENDSHKENYEKEENNLFLHGRREGINKKLYSYNINVENDKEKSKKKITEIKNSHENNSFLLKRHNNDNNRDFSKNNNMHYIDNKNDVSNFYIDKDNENNLEDKNNIDNIENKENIDSLENKNNISKIKNFNELISNSIEKEMNNLKSEENYSDDDIYSDSNNKDKYVVGICKFMKYKLHEKCSELINLFISFYVNRISHIIKLYIENEKWIEDKEAELVSNNFIYIIKEIDKIHICLTDFFDNKVKNVKKIDNFSEIFIKIEKELEQICKKYLKEKNFNSSNDLENIMKISNNDNNNNNNNNNNNSSIHPSNQQRNLEMYMYKLYMLKMKNYKKNVKLENSRILFIIIKIMFKDYTEYIRNSIFNEKGFNKLKIDFFFYFHCLKHYVPLDDENILFVILNEVLINAKERMIQVNKKVESKSNILYHSYLSDNIEFDINKNKNFILKSLKEN